MNTLSTLLTACLKKNLPFVAYRLPGQAKPLVWIQRSGAVQFVEHFRDLPDVPGFVYAPFHRKTDFPLVFFEPEIRFEEDNFDTDLLAEINRMDPLYPQSTLPEPVEVTKKEYLEQASFLIGSFDGTFQKAVLSRIKVVDRPESFRPANFFEKVMHAHPNTFCHIINIPGAGCWTGASPETLVRSDSRRCHTMALAGTLPYTGTLKPDWGKKEQEEQHIVMTYLEHVLKDLRIDSFSRTGPETVQAGKVVHLLTKYNFELNPEPGALQDLITGLHPTPAVCGLPKEQALKNILSTEKHNREYYAGYCGPVNIDNKTDLFVNLRCMKIFPDKLALYTGGGLTAGSDPEKEWEETEMKATSLLSVI